MKTLVHTEVQAEHAKIVGRRFIELPFVPTVGMDLLGLASGHIELRISTVTYWVGRSNELFITAFADLGDDLDADDRMICYGEGWAWIKEGKPWMCGCGKLATMHIEDQPYCSLDCAQKSEVLGGV